MSPQHLIWPPQMFPGHNIPASNQKRAGSFLGGPHLRATPCARAHMLQPMPGPRCFGRTLGSSPLGRRRCSRHRQALRVSAPITLYKELLKYHFFKMCWICFEILGGFFGFFFEISNFFLGFLGSKNMKKIGKKTNKNETILENPFF